MPIITIKIAKGRTTDQKRELVKEITDSVVSTGLSKKAYLEFLESFFVLLKRNVKKKTRLAFISRYVIVLDQVGLATAGEDFVDDEISK
ncbi:MAG: tautomerase family protein [Deltaproteobacteria bacterium]|nr:tautomerase family protein [Candidatus Desulfobacula maris]MBL6996435.1 tautomerase family protein [Desulfobacula sp.]